MLVEATRDGQSAALARYGIKQSEFNPHAPLPVARPGVMSTPSTRPAIPTAMPSPPATAVPPVPAGPSVLDRGRAIGQQVGGAASRFMRSATRPLTMMGIGALGASALSHGHPHDDGQLAYTPLPGSFIQ